MHKIFAKCLQPFAITLCKPYLGLLMVINEYQMVLSSNNIHQAVIRFMTKLTTVMNWEICKTSAKGCELAPSEIMTYTNVHKTATTWLLRRFYALYCTAYTYEWSLAYKYVCMPLHIYNYLINMFTCSFACTSTPYLSTSISTILAWSCIVA